MPVSGLFGLVCAACGDELELLDDGAAECRACHQRYLPRVGYLIPTDSAPPVSEPSAQLGGVS